MIASSKERRISTGNRSSFLSKSLRKMDRSIQKEGYGHSVTCIDSSNENSVIRFLLSERVFGYPGTDGSVLSNYKHYVFNSHPLLSIFFMHRQHPFERKKRIIVFLCTFAFTIFMSFVLLDGTFMMSWIAVCREGCNKKEISQGQQICSGGYNDGLQYDQYDKKCTVLFCNTIFFSRYYNISDYK